MIYKFIYSNLLNTIPGRNNSQGWEKVENLGLNNCQGWERDKRKSFDSY